MPTETATIRVTRATRDRLAGQARARGVSLAVFLSQVAQERDAEAAWRSEREATRRDATNAEVAEEDRAWDSALRDGFG